MFSRNWGEMMAIKMQQKLKNCSVCGRMFVATRGEKLCRDCIIKEEEKEREVLDYVREHQGCPISEVVEAMGITDKFIKNMINKGLFANVERNDMYYPCSSCGKPIRHGTYCSDCLSRLRNETKKMADQMAIKMGISDKPFSKMSTIEKLNAQAEREFEIENKRFSQKSMYEKIVNKRDNRSVGKGKK